ncbi:uncharacterized protein [Gossypium hirsutum]|uniref:Uncharacterized protein n=1 Tax=Gossypium hirsutum TaxID=3635 RepID=A0A1U8IY70_GOSHI|nr:uncharacterized protein LOC107899628 [Gossypium hirsutum]
MPIHRNEWRSACSSLKVIFFPPYTLLGPRFQRSRGDLTAYSRGTESAGIVRRCGRGVRGLCAGAVGGVVWRDVVRPLVRAAAQGDPCLRVCKNWAQFLGCLGYWAMSFCKWTCNLGLGSLGLIWFDFGL